MDFQTAQAGWVIEGSRARKFQPLKGWLIQDSPKLTRNILERPKTTLRLEPQGSLLSVQLSLILCITTPENFKKGCHE
jgi:hypothetical protein